MEEKKKNENTLVKEMQNLHKMMQKTLEVEKGECFFGVMQQGEALTKAYYGDVNTISQTLMAAVTSDEVLAQAILSNICDVPGYAELITSLAIKFDPKQLNLDSDARVVVAEALRELADKFQNTK